MAIGEDKIKDLFSSKLGESFEPEVPASIWGGLDLLLSQSMPLTDPTSITSSGSGGSASSGSTASSSGASTASSTATTAAVKAGIVIGVAAIVTTASVVIYNHNADRDLSQVEAVPKVETVEKSNDVLDQVHDTDTTFVSTPSLFAENSPERMVKTKSAVNLKGEAGQTSSSEIKEVVKEEPEEKKTDEIKEVNEEPQPQEDVEITVEKPKKNSYYLAIKVSPSLIGLKTKQYGSNGMLFSENMRSREFLSFLTQENAHYTLTHQRPVAVSLLLGKNLNDNLAVETGLYYTHLHSKVTSTSRTNINETQDLDYLGIPLNIKYSLGGLGKSTFHFSGGLLIEKDISGLLISQVDLPKDANFRSSLYYNEPYYLEKGIRQNNLQFSVNASFGLSYPIYKGLYLFGQIGSAYYIDAGNRYRTIYSDMPIQINSDLGIKIDF